MFGEREILEEAADRWWIFLVTGIGWLVFALVVFQWDYTTVYAISILFGVVALVAAMNEFMAITYSTTGWKWVHGVLGVLFAIAGIWALVHPHAAFRTLAGLRRAVEGSAHSGLEVSGVTLEVARDEAGKRDVLAVKVGDKPLDPKASYRVAMNSFMAANSTTTPNRIEMAYTVV